MDYIFLMRRNKFQGGCNTFIYILSFHEHGNCYKFQSSQVRVTHNQSIGLIHNHSSKCLMLGYDNYQNSYEGNQSPAPTTKILALFS